MKFSTSDSFPLIMSHIPNLGIPCVLCFTGGKRETTILFKCSGDGRNDEPAFFSVSNASSNVTFGLPGTLNVNMKHQDCSLCFLFQLNLDPTSSIQ